MPLFLIFFLSIYGGMHAFAFYRMRDAFSPGRPAALLLAVLMLVMTLAPLLVRLSENAGMDRCALFIAWPGYVWMGVIFIFLSALFVADAVRGSFWLANAIFSVQPPVFLTPRNCCISALLTAFIASGYACYEARQIQIERVTVNSAKLPPEVRRIRIAQISDVHVGLLFSEALLERVLKVIREAEPDVIVSTGDLVDGKLNREDAKSHQDSLARMLASLSAPSGKFAVTGNHELYAGLKQALAFTSAAGFTLLRNRSVQLPNGVTISGVDDHAITGSNSTTQNAEKNLLESVPKGVFHLLLKHRPEIPAFGDGLFDLQLSGHAHKGQIFPFSFLVRLQYPIPCGTTRTREGSTIHVSRGTGTWGPPMRLFASPEVTVIDIVPVR